MIDVGINRSTRGARAGSSATAISTTAPTRPAHITPVPGGVGPMTIACLLANTLKAACLARGLPPPVIGK